MIDEPPSQSDHVPAEIHAPMPPDPDPGPGPDQQAEFSASEPPATAGSAPSRPARNWRFTVPVVAVLILIAGLTSVWWLPLVRERLHASQPEAATISGVPNAAPPDAVAPDTATTDAAPGETATPPADAAATKPTEPPPPVAVATPPAGPTAAQLTARLDRLDEAVSGLVDGTGNLASKSDLDTLDRRVTGLGQKLENYAEKASAGPEQLAALSDTVKQLGDRLTAINGQMQQQDDARQHGAALVLAASEVTVAVATSTSYSAPLRLLQSLADDPAIAREAAVLGKYEAEDVPSRAKLEWELQQLPARFDEPVKGVEGGGFWHRVLQRIEGLVKIHRTGDVAADGAASPVSVVAGAETELAGGDLGAAIQSMETLQGKPAEMAAPWLVEARARLQLEQASQALQTAALQKLTPAGASP